MCLLSRDDPLGLELPSECPTFFSSLCLFSIMKNSRTCILFLGSAAVFHVEDGPPPSPFSPHHHSSLTVDRLLHLHSSPPSPFAPLPFHHHAHPCTFTICPPPSPLRRQDGVAPGRCQQEGASISSTSQDPRPFVIVSAWSGVTQERPLCPSGRFVTFHVRARQPLSCSGGYTGSGEGVGFIRCVWQCLHCGASVECDPCPGSGHGLPLPCLF